MIVMVDEVADIDLAGRSFDELEEIHEAVMAQKQKLAVEKQNELIRQYAALRAEMVKYGVCKEDDLPRFKQRGWKRSTTAH